MSAVSGMETRLKHILRGAPERSLKLLLAGPCSVAALVLMTALTTARIEQVAAQDESAPSSERNDQPPAETIATENDLFSRVRDCDVLTVTGDEFGAIFTASGQVVSPEGEPVEGAIVLLRESSNSRISSDPEKYLNANDRSLLRVPDVFARTVTGHYGEFEFREVKSPAPSNSWSNSWL
jgi:hypothetical protein